MDNERLNTLVLLEEEMTGTKKEKAKENEINQAS